MGMVVLEVTRKIQRDQQKLALNVNELFRAPTTTYGQ
jgi:hypothetical protein